MPALHRNYERETTTHPVAVAVRNFTAQTIGLIDIFDILVDPLRGQLNIAEEEFRSVEATRNLDDAILDQTPHPMPLEKQTAYIICKQRLDDAHFAFDSIPRALLLSLVAIYDNFLRDHIKAIYQIKSELRSTIKTSYTVPELIELSDLNNAIEAGMERHLDNVLRENHLAQLQWLENLLGMKLTVNVPALPRFIELTERRNMIAHCGGIATPFYVTQCRRYKIEPGTDVGKPLTVDKPYFTECYDRIFEIGVKLSQCTWRKIRSDEIGLADHILRSITYTLLVAERFELAKILLEFAQALKRHSSDNITRIFTVNLAQCYKWLGETEKCQEVLHSRDWTAAEPAFVLAHCVLNDDFVEAKKYT